MPNTTFKSETSAYLYTDSSVLVKQILQMKCYFLWTAQAQIVAKFVEKYDIFIFIIIF